MYHLNSNLLFLQIKETGKIAISNGCIELNEVILIQNSPEEQSNVTQQSKLTLKSKAIFDRMANELMEPNDALKALGNAFILYEISSNSDGQDGKKIVTKYSK